MSRDSILKIKEAEQKAERIVEAARAEARAMIERAEAEGHALCEAAEAEASEGDGVVKEQLYARTAETVAKADGEARAEAEAIRKNAFLNKRGAEKIVIRGLMSKCR